MSTAISSPLLSDLRGNPRSNQRSRSLFVPAPATPAAAAAVDPVFTAAVTSRVIFSGFCKIYREASEASEAKNLDKKAVAAKAAKAARIAKAASGGQFFNLSSPNLATDLTHDAWYDVRTGRTGETQGTFCSDIVAIKRAVIQAHLPSFEAHRALVMQMKSIRGGIPAERLGKRKEALTASDALLSWNIMESLVACQRASSSAEVNSIFAGVQKKQEDLACLLKRKFALEEKFFNAKVFDMVVYFKGRKNAVDIVLDANSSNSLPRVGAKSLKNDLIEFVRHHLAHTRPEWSAGNGGCGVARFSIKSLQACSLQGLSEKVSRLSHDVVFVSSGQEDFIPDDVTRQMVTAFGSGLPGSAVHNRHSAHDTAASTHEKTDPYQGNLTNEIHYA